MDLMVTILICGGISILFAFFGASSGDIGTSDCITLGITAGVVCGRHLGVHPAICIVIGLFATVFLGIMQGNRILYWIIGILVGACNALMIGAFVAAIAGGDMVWFAVTIGLVFMVAIGLHLNSHCTESAGKYNVPLIIVNAVFHNEEKTEYHFSDEDKSIK